MARKPDKRVYVRRNRVRRKLNKRRAWAPISSRAPYKLQQANLLLIQRLEASLAAG